MKRAIAIVLAVGAASCTAAGDTPVANAPGNGPPAPPAKALLQVPNRGLANSRPTSIDRVSFEGDRSKLRVLYWTGVEDCYGLDRVDQRWTKDSVTLTVFTGTKRLPANTACDAIAVSAATIVALAQELGNRAVIDGSTGEQVQFR